MSLEKATSKQCLHIASEFAEILHDSGVSKGELQHAVLHKNHQLYDALRQAVADSFITSSFTKNKPNPLLEEQTSVKRSLAAWRSVKTGGIKTEALIKEIGQEKGDKEKNEIGSYALDLMGKPAFVIAETLADVDLVTLTPRDLGFKRSPRTDAFMTKEFCADWSAKHLDGYVIELCEPEDGPQLRLQYQDQPINETVWMAMERMTDSDGYPDVFYVGRRDVGERWLYASWASPGDTWDLARRIVFRLRKLPQPSVT